MVEPITEEPQISYNTEGQEKFTVGYFYVKIVHVVMEYFHLLDLHGSTINF